MNTTPQIKTTPPHSLAPRQPQRRRPLSAALGCLLGALLLLQTTGCDTTRQEPARLVEPSGFLGDYSKMLVDQKNRPVMVYVKPDVNWKMYTKIWIKPIELWDSGDPDSPMGGISPENRQKLIDLLHTSLVNTLSKDYTLVDHGGPDVLIIHGAITDAKKSHMIAGMASTVYVPLRVASLGKQTLVGTGIGSGAVAIEAEFLDGQTNERLAAVVDKRGGSNRLRAKIGGTWHDVSAAFDWWASRLALRLSQGREGKSWN